MLDDYEVSSALLDENAHMWVWPSDAVPIRFVVSEEEAEEASKLLDGDLEGAAAIQEREMEGDSTAQISRSGLVSNNPWEMLAIAFAFVLPAVCFLQIEYPDVPRTFNFRNEFAAVDVIIFLAGLELFSRSAWLFCIFVSIDCEALRRRVAVSQPASLSKCCDE